MTFPKTGSALHLVKTIDYDAFGDVLSDSNPALFMPLAFAGGLRDRFTGLVRFCHRDYDPTVGRSTAPDSLATPALPPDLFAKDSPILSIFANKLARRSR